MENFFTQFFRRYFYYFDSYPLVIQIAVFLTLIAIVTTIIAYSNILIERAQAYIKEKYLAKINPFIDELVTEHIVLNKDLLNGVPLAEIKLATEAFKHPRLTSERGKQALIDRLVSYRRNISGDVGNLITRLYIELELDNFSLKKIKSFKWSNKVVGLTELTVMDVSIADVIILPLTNSKNKELRSVARNSYVKLSKNEPFKFFDLATEPLLQWDQIELFRTITSSKDIAIPNFARWISYSPNKSVVSFCLKLIVFYNQREGIPAIIKLLDNRDHYLRADAINALGKLKAVEAEDKLLTIYNNQPLNCQIEILKAIGRFGTGKNLDFLRYQFLNSNDFEIRKNAAKSIAKQKSLEAEKMIEELLATSTKQNYLIIKHVLNPLIKY